MNIIDTRAIWSSEELSPDYFKEQFVGLFLDKWLRSAQWQIDRIETAKKALDKSVKKNITSQTIDNSWAEHHELLFMDIHFFLIAMANVAKAMERMKKLRSYDSHFGNIYKKNEVELKTLIRLFRNCLEHITEKPLDGVDRKGKPLKNPRDLGNLEGDTYSLFGEKFHIPSTFKMFGKMVEELKNWSDEKVREFYSRQSDESK